MRSCPVCDSELLPRFASECEAPVAWACPECGLFQLETGGRAFSPEEEEAIRAMAPLAAPQPPRAVRRHSRAAVQASEVLDALGGGVPVDVEAIAERLGYPVRWRALPRDRRGGIEGEPAHRVLVLNKEYPFHSDVERRWAVAEELAHAVLGHGTLVASEEPGHGRVLREPARHAQEREARAFAAELLMPAAEVRQGFQREQGIILRAIGAEARTRAVRTVIADLAREFRVSQQAMRIRLGELGLLT